MDFPTVIMIVIVVLVLAGMIIMPMFTNKKRNNQANELYSNLAPGDRIMTIGGIIGVVVQIEETSPVEKRILIETGAEGSKTTIWLDVKGIYQNLSKPPPEKTGLFGKSKSEASVIPPLPNPDASEQPPAAEPFADQDLSVYESKLRDFDVPKEDK